MGFATFGNELYSGRRSINFIGRRRLWYIIAGAMTVLSLLALLVFRLNPGVDFTGGSEFQLTKLSDTSEQLGTDAVTSVVSGSEPRVSRLGVDGMNVSVEKLSDQQTEQVKQALAKAYKVSATSITVNFVGPSWGQDVSRKALQGLIVFMVLVGIVISVYFRNWKVAAAALVALVHDLIITVGVYALVGFEVTPATVIGFLTILGYSLYDTVVVFDKVRENTEGITNSTRRTYDEAANLAVNQTLVRSINTSVVALLPVASILFIGAFLLHAGTLKDISLSLFVGIAAGTYSSIFIATPLLVDLRRREPDIAAHTAKLLRRRSDAPVKGGSADGSRPSVLDDEDDDDLPAAQPVGAGPAHGSPPAGTRAGATALAPAPGKRQQPKKSGKPRQSGRKR